jgi:type IV pilus assembly protein PilV
MLSISRQQHGVSLVESMIALLVISIGLLGIAALQVTSISQNSSAFHHSQAVWAAYDMSDRIRANSSSFASYNGIKTSIGYSQDCTGIANVCTSAQMVTADAADWETMVGNLPSGQGQIIAQTNPSELLIAVMWDDGGTPGGGSNGAVCPVATLSCYTVVVAQ